MKLRPVISAVLAILVCSVLALAQDPSATRPRRANEAQRTAVVNPEQAESPPNGMRESETNASILASWVAVDRAETNDAIQARVKNMLWPESAARRSLGWNSNERTGTNPVALTRLPVRREDTPAEACQRSTDPDCREGFQGTFYVGYAVDTFASSELRRYINPNDSGGVSERFVGGFDFQYRLNGDPKSTMDQLWVYGETVHGVRSADVDCAANPNLAVCKDLFDPVNAPDATLFILRNATSLEAFAGLRYEFKTLNAKTNYAANLYLKGQLGFLTVAGSGADVVDMHHIALGAIATKGKFQGSYLEVGFGKTDLFKENRNRRFKVDGFLSWELPGPLKNRMRPFAQMTVDADLGPHSDSIQSYFGFEFDVVCLFKLANNCSN